VILEITKMIVFVIVVPSSLHERPQCGQFTNPIFAQRAHCCPVSIGLFGTARIKKQFLHEEETLQWVFVIAC